MVSVAFVLVLYMLRMCMLGMRMLRMHPSGTIAFAAVLLALVLRPITFARAFRRSVPVLFLVGLSAIEARFTMRIRLARLRVVLRGRLSGL